MDIKALPQVVITIIAQQISKQADDIHENATFDSLGMDSLDRVEVVMKIEESLNIEMNDERVDQLKTVGELIRYCEELKK